MANFQKIKTIAKEKNISLGELAERVVITPTGLSLIMRTNATNTQTIEKIAKELGVKVGVFFDEEEDAKADGKDINSIIAQKDALIAQLNKLIEQKDMIIDMLNRK